MRTEVREVALADLLQALRSGALDPQPDYQRGDVWDRTRRLRLIDTLLRDWYIPPIHVVGERPGASDGRDAVLDGQQRLNALVAFFDSELRISPSEKVGPYNADIESVAGRTFNELPLEWQDRLLAFRLSVVRLTDYKPEEPAELFFRLNQAYALTPSEKRNSLYGDVRDEVRALVGDLRGSYLSKQNVGFDNGRLAYEDVLARVCVALQGNTLRQPLTNSVLENFYRRESFSPAVLSRARAAGRSLGEALQSAGGLRMNKATLFSWLMFADAQLSQADQEVEASFIVQFSKLKAQRDRSDTGYRSVAAGDVGPLVDAFADRSSYRVLDVSSVLIRDIALHLCHAILVGPVGREHDLLVASRRAGPYDVESSLMTLAEELNWGYTL